MNSSRTRGVVFGFILCCGMAGHAQSGTPPQEKPTAPLPDAPSQTQKVSPAEKDEHIFHIIPTVDVTDPHYPVRPLTTSQKFELFTNTAFDRFTFIKAGASAGIDQGRETPEGYGQGAEGFGRRYGAAFATQVYSNFFTRFAFPSLLHQDPRYFRKGQGRAGPRIGYAISRVVVTQGDNGRRQFNLSRVLGSLFTAALTNAYYPEEERTAGRTFARAGREMASSAALNVLREFAPQLRRKMFRKRTKEIPAPAAKPDQPPPR
ncbi:MAG: hypothetical protein ACRD2M_01290 [Terriglobales bacterium]